jgi:hypothetical protein
MKIKTAERLTATITIGRLFGYSNDEYSIKELYSALQEYQNKRIDEAGIYLSAFVHGGDIVMSGQIEAHYKLEFINYPKFPLSKRVFKDEIVRLGKHLIFTFKQNRLVIIFDDEIIMLEENETIDPRIKFNK